MTTATITSPDYIELPDSYVILSSFDYDGATYISLDTRAIVPGGRDGDVLMTLTQARDLIARLLAIVDAAG